MERSNKVNYSPSGEPLKIESGYLAVIDQFMLANEQFVQPLQNLLEKSDGFDVNIDKFRNLIQSYGGCLVELGEGDYQVLRDPGEKVIWIASGGGGVEAKAHSTPPTRTDAPPTGRVFVDTRCIVFIDPERFRETTFFSDYEKYRERGDEKKGRDLLRRHGAAVRYGFQRYGDELGVFRLFDSAQLALWPDVIE